MQRHRITTIAAEAASFSPGRFTMAVGLCMSIGAATGVAAALGLELYELPPKRWQRAILGRKEKDRIRSWEATRPTAPAALFEAVRGVLQAVITEVRRAAKVQSPAALVGATLESSIRTTHDNERPPPSPHLRI